MELFVRIDHVTLQVHDLRRSIEFYTQKLGFNVNEKVKQVKDYVSLTSGNAIIELYGGGTVGPERQEKGVGMVHIALKTASFDETYETLVKRGVEFHIKPFRQSMSGRKIAFFKDPDGTALHLTT